MAGPTHVIHFKANTRIQGTMHSPQATQDSAFGENQLQCQICVQPLPGRLVAHGWHLRLQEVTIIMVESRNLQDLVASTV